MLRAGELDVAVIHHYPPLGPDPGPDLSCTALVEDPFALVLPPDHPLTRRQRLPIAALASEAFLFPRSREGHGGTYNRLMRGACAVAGFEPYVLFEINDCQTVQAFVAAGLVIAVLPRLALDPVHPRVTVCELADAPSRRVLAARLAGAAPSAIADQAIALLRDAAAGR